MGPGGQEGAILTLPGPWSRPLGPALGSCSRELPAQRLMGEVSALATQTGNQGDRRQLHRARPAHPQLITRLAQQRGFP